MRIKKFITAGVASILAAVLFVTPVSAHHGQRVGHHGRSQDTTASTVSAACGVCHLDNCASTGRHTHDGAAYCGFDHASGICDGTCAALCTVEGCTITGRHTHNGTAYCGYHHESGFCDGTCVALCQAAGCTSTERHVHDGVTYCGYSHENGFCDGSCQIVP